MASSRITAEASKLDDAARAGWLYYVAGNTQDEIARKLGVSRQSVQRLVSLAVSERLVKVRIDHPIGRCMDFRKALIEKFGLQFADVVPSDPDHPDLLNGVAIATAEALERILKQPDEKIIALGTGRALKACVEQIPRMECPQHRIVSLLGNMMWDGSATPYNATIRMADRVGAQHYPYPLPVLARDEQELRNLHAQEAVRNTLELCHQADFTLVGIGNMDSKAPAVIDGFVTKDELPELLELGAIGEITGWNYDAQGKIMDCAYNRRVTSAPVKANPDRLVVGVAVGPIKVKAIHAALIGHLINGLITNESTAEALLAI